MGAEIDENTFKIGKRSENKIHVWVLFKDKGLTEIESDTLLSKLELQMDNRVKYRRGKTRGAFIVDEKDIPVNQIYIQQIVDLGGTIRTKSKWLNAVSISATKETIYLINELNCVKKIHPVFAGKRKEDVLNHRVQKTTNTTTVYGLSYSQLNQINVIEAHNAGFAGQGVRVLMLDTGYYKDHEAIQNDKIIGEWDFINNDSETQNELGDHSSQHNHGTVTLSVLGGRKDSVLVGAAYDAEFLLAKTEDITDEQPIEEDYYVAGLEWGEENGADIASSSLGYIDWYESSDLDGLTAVTTIAVNQAIANGMIVATAAGNSGEEGLIAPADAFNVITCGAVDSMGHIASFSSWGPTADGRTKPEICARGVATFCAGSYNPEHYYEANGTSLSTPLIGGACAIILSAHPGWTPSMVREALMMTADNIENPDNQYGWGVIDVMAAINYNGFAHIDDETIIPSNFSISNPYPNPFNAKTKFTVDVQIKGYLTVDIVNLRGEVVQTLINNYIEADHYVYEWNAGSIASGMFFVRANIGDQTIIRKICLIK